jgi:hypothetical protein
MSEVTAREALFAMRDSMTERLNALEAQVDVIDETLHGDEAQILGADIFRQTKSLEDVDTVQIPWGDFPDMVKERPQEAISLVIQHIRTSLSTKAMTKKLIEKANCQYVDSSFQRVSTQLTALINQRVLQNHNQLEKEINDLIHETEVLKDNMAHQFAEIRGLIQECREQKEEMERTQDCRPKRPGETMPRRGTLTRALGAPLAPLTRLQAAPLLRSKREVMQGDERLSMTLTPVKGLH